MGQEESQEVEKSERNFRPWEIAGRDEEGRPSQKVERRNLDRASGPTGSTWCLVYKKFGELG